MVLLGWALAAPVLGEREGHPTAPPVSTTSVPQARTAPPGAKFRPGADMPTGSTVAVRTAPTLAPAESPTTLAPAPSPNPPPTPPLGQAAGSANATTTLPPLPARVEAPAGGKFAAEVLALIDYRWEDRLSDWTLVFQPGRSGYLGGTYTATRRIEVYVRDGQSPQEIAFTVAHEIGHAIDVTYFSDADRQRWETARGFSAPWWAGSGVSDYASGSGDFAESFAAWQVGGPSLSKLGGQPTAKQVQVLESLVNR